MSNRRTQGDAQDPLVEPRAAPLASSLSSEGRVCTFAESLPVGRLALPEEVEPEELERLRSELDKRIETGAKVIELDMDAVDHLDASVVAELAQILRNTSRRCEILRVLRAPQTLAHTMYRIGALERYRVELVEPRNELGSSS